MGGRFTLWPFRHSHRPSCLSLGAATPRAPAARSVVAHERLGPWRERPPSPRAWYGSGAGVFSHPCPRPLGRSRAINPWREGQRHRTSPGHVRGLLFAPHAQTVRGTCGSSQTRGVARGWGPAPACCAPVAPPANAAGFRGRWAPGSPIRVGYRRGMSIGTEHEGATASAWVMVRLCPLAGHGRDSTMTRAHVLRREEIGPLCGDAGSTRMHTHGSPSLRPV